MYAQNRYQQQQQWRRRLLCAKTTFAVLFIYIDNDDHSIRNSLPGWGRNVIVIYGCCIAAQVGLCEWVDVVYLVAERTIYCMIIVMMIIILIVMLWLKLNISSHRSKLLNIFFCYHAHGSQQWEEFYKSWIYILFFLIFRFDWELTDLRIKLNKDETFEPTHSKFYYYHSYDAIRNMSVNCISTCFSSTCA